MKKTFQIMRNEILTTLGRTSYLLLTVGIPVLGILVFAVVTIIKNQSAGQSPDETDQSEATELKVEGYIDQAGLINSLPPDIPDDQLLPYENEADAQSALAADQISAYYLIPQDYVESGELYYIRPNYNLFSSDSQDWMMRWVLMYNLSDEDPELASFIWQPLSVETHNLTAESSPEAAASEACLTPGYGCESNAFIRMLPLFVLILFFVFISTSAGLLLRSVSIEKQNLTIETLLLSVRPIELLSGKVIGLGLVALLQMILWVGTGFIIIRLGGNTLNLPPGFSLPDSFLIWGLILFVCGYAIYASLMAGLGALVPDIKAASQASFIVMLPLLVGYMLSVFPPVQENPHGLLATVLSIFPFTAPTVMMLRLTVGGVPTWQLILTVVLLVLTTILVVRSVARMFRAQTILSGQPFSPKIYLTTLLGRN